MSVATRVLLLVLILILLLSSLFVSGVGADSAAAPAALPPSSYSPFQGPIHTYPPTLFATILAKLGFQELSTATASANLSATTPLTIFAPTDSSLLTCASCSIPLLIQELSLPGLYPYHFLESLSFGTKIETLAPNRCLTITSNGKDKVFVNGVEVTSPDLFNNGMVVIHGLQGYVSHLSPLSCHVEMMTSLSFPSPSLSAAATSPSLYIMRLMLKDAIVRLRSTGFNIVSLALRVKYHELVELKSITIFALDDVAIFSGEGHAYLSNFRYHVVPNKRLTAAELVTLPATTLLPTMEAGNYLVVTTAGGGGHLAPMKINYVKVTTIDLLHNSRIVVHGISSPFPHMLRHHPFEENDSSASTDMQHSKCDQFDWNRGICVVEDGVPTEMPVEDHRGL
ncbi:fasciclin-like arabinogalactan protein 21 [Andrographis paniculata]|uniref:fasciclin-like arabinogalactan protein 21 n=1 Tax=Andrographis paniculata TaxID=175694 RepID=UPI0021E71A93|nr:fasciclin-like arabinogalactan protein 21 [Andrographis paniculata]